MLANLENEAGVARLERVSFHSYPKEQRKAMPKNVQTSVQLHSFHMLQGDSQNPSS